jgi:hypothetical protein
MPKSNRIQTLRELKKEGHDYIDRLAKIGVTKDQSYQRISRELGRSEHGSHFSRIYTIRDAQKAIEALKILEVERKERIALKREEARKERQKVTEERIKKAAIAKANAIRAPKNILPLAEQKAAIARMKESKNQVSLWHRLFTWVHNLLSCA